MTASSRVVSLSRETGSVEDKGDKNRAIICVDCREKRKKDFICAAAIASNERSLRTSASHVKDKLLPVLTWLSGDVISLLPSGGLKTVESGYCKATESLHVVSVLNRRKRNKHDPYGLLQ